MTAMTVLDLKKRVREKHVPLINILAEYLKTQKVSLVIVGQSSLEEIKEKTDYEMKMLSEYDGSRVYLRKNLTYADILYRDLPQYSIDYFKYILFDFYKEAPIVSKKRGLYHSNLISKYINIMNGFRHTVGVPIEYENSIYIFGNSMTFSSGSEDKHTIASFLQKSINDNFEKNYAVLNYSVCGVDSLEIIYTILQTKFIPGDIIILHGYLNRYFNEITPYFDQEDLLIQCDFNKRSPGENIFIDEGHVTYKGNKIVAEEIYEHIFNKYQELFIENNNLVSYSRSTKITDEAITGAKEYIEQLEKKYKDVNSNYNNSPELLSYLEELKGLKLREGSVGSIVMNCNPFTKGHRYLIEYAAKQVDNLVIFVVEEDRSAFTFKDRFKLVCEGTKDLDNVFVIRSGSFIISSITFPEYFEKEKEMDAKFDASNDLDFFGEYIAPALGIKTRFVGQEPNCKITNEYNRQMKVVLPTYGIKVKEIPRKTFNDKPISASLVRKFLNNGEIEKLKEIVPITTYNHLQQENISAPSVH